MSNIPLSERSHWVGASESAALFGVSPYTTEFKLWHQKKGNIDPDDLDHNQRVMAGKHLEPSIAAWANEKWGWDLANVEVYSRHPGVKQMGASLDFATAGGEPVEIKNVDYSEFLKHFQAEGDEIVDAPLHMLIQVQHQIACRPDNPARGWLVPCAGGNRLYRMPLPRHDALIQRIEAKVAAFWTSIRENVEPDPVFDLDAETIGMLYGGTNDFADLRSDARAIELCREYREAHAITTAADKRKKAALAEIKTLLDDARVALVGDTYKVGAAWIKPATIERQGYWRFNVSEPKKR